MFGIKTRVETFLRTNFWKLCLKGKVEKIREKKEIRVLFILTELSPWKTEILYKRMLAHSRFCPILGLSRSSETPSAYGQLKDYCDHKGYDVIDLDRISLKDVNPDIIFYQKPYLGVYNKRLRYTRIWPRLICHVNYAFHTINEEWGIWQPMYNYVWQHYYENHLALDERICRMENNGKNVLVTGMPIQDYFLTPSKDIENPWKNVDSKKRIIYAPHHSIGNLHLDGIGFATFLDHAEFMLSLAEKYRDHVQFAFKPHPLLFEKLLSVWGSERTESYYNAWKSMENTQLESGAYIGLFLHSDAMIHDCSSFTVEYHYSKKPVLYLIKDEHHADNLGAFGKKAFDLHYKARTQGDIEIFIKNVIAGNDPMKPDRERFYEESLLPPNGKSACDNIIDAILGLNVSSRK